MQASDPIIITLLDGRTAALRLTMGGLRRLLARFGAKSMQDLWTQAGEVSAVIGLLYEALPADLRESLTEEQFGDLLPVELEEIAGTARKLLGVGQDRPTQAPGQAQ